MDYKEVFVTYGFLLDQRFDIGNYGCVLEDSGRIILQLSGQALDLLLSLILTGYLNLQSFHFWDGIHNYDPILETKSSLW